LDHRALSLAADGEGRIFVGTENGLYRLELTSFVDLGYPTRSGSGVRMPRSRRVASVTQVAGTEGGAFSLLGRRLQGPQAAGFRAAVP
jgi:ligand-binding sensor domain-containing protein